MLRINEMEMGFEVFNIETIFNNELRNEYGFESMLPFVHTIEELAKEYHVDEYDIHISSEQLRILSESRMINELELFIKDLISYWNNLSELPEDIMEELNGYYSKYKSSILNARFKKK